MSLNQDLNESLIGNLEKDLFENFLPLYQYIPDSENNDMILTYNIPQTGLWKIESENQEVGGDVEWYKPYRFRHLISGKYLSVDVSIKNNK